MKHNISFLTVLVTSLAVQLPILSRVYAQTLVKSSGSFMMRQNMAIDERFQYLGFKLESQQKEEWFDRLFMEEVSQTMRIENIQAIELTEMDFASSRSDNRLELVEF